MTPHARAQIQTLLLQLADGDRSAVEPAFALLWPLVRSFAARMLSGADAEDAAQQALTKLFEQAPLFDPSRDGVAWVLSIVHFECRTIQRRAQRRREQPLEAASDQPDRDTPELIANRRALGEAAREVLAGLREEDVRVILASLEDDRPRADATYRKRLQRALARLRLAWSGAHGSE